ncbi:MAG: hypothetical protein SWE60_03115 [Thermodesulfobacteriota bacterium]|nr:hypothetical protein [Thermodesulfobacteriota bacterium]
MRSKAGICVVVLGVLMFFSVFALASPPVPPPVEGFNIGTVVDVEMSAGDCTQLEAFTWTWMHDADG